MNSKLNSTSLSLSSKPNLTLAIMIHFNVYFSLIYLFLEGGLIHEKLSRFQFQDDLHQYSLFPIYGMYIIIIISISYQLYDASPHVFLNDSNRLPCSFV